MHGKHVGMKDLINQVVSQEEKYIHQDIKLAHMEKYLICQDRSQGFKPEFGRDKTSSLGGIL